MHEAYFTEKLKEYWDYGDFYTYDGFKKAMLELIAEGFDEGYKCGRDDGALISNGYEAENRNL